MNYMNYRIKSVFCVKNQLKVFLIFVIFLVTLSTMSISTASGNNVSFNQAPPTPPQPGYGPSQIIISIYDHGGVEYALLKEILNPNLSCVGISESDEQYGVLTQFGLVIQPTSLTLDIFVLFQGNYVNNADYINYATMIRDNLKTKIMDVGLSFGDERFIAHYLEDTDVSFFNWDYQYTDTYSPFQELSQLAYSVANSSFFDYLKISDQWSANSFMIIYYKSGSEGSMESVIYLDASRENVFAGNGTHQFSFKEITGLSTLTSINEEMYIVIGLPIEAEIDPASIDVGEATYTLVGNTLLVTASAGAEINDITFNFNHDFPVSSEEEEQPPPPPPGDGGDSGQLLSNYATYIVVGVLVIVGVIIIAKKITS